jgi:hypothetical protein
MSTTTTATATTTTTTTTTTAAAAAAAASGYYSHSTVAALKDLPTLLPVYSYCFAYLWFLNVS